MPSGSGLLLQERDAARREAGCIVFSPVSSTPYEIVEWGLDRAQHQLLHYLRALGVGSSAAAGNHTAPNDYVQLAQRRVLPRFGEPRHAYRRRRRLPNAAIWRPMLFDRELGCVAPLEHAFGRELIQQRRDCTLHNVLLLRTARSGPGSKGLVRVVHVSVRKTNRRKCGEAAREMCSAAAALN